MNRRQAVFKRAFDVAVSATGLLLSGWLIAIAWIAATIDTRQNGFFLQARIGRHGRAFRVVKIRTMRDVPGRMTTVTVGDDPRITRLGRFLRRTKIDELPQLFNVLCGQMSLVGPRPDVAGFADALHGDDRVVLTVRPGITGPATLKYRREEEMLRDARDAEAMNRDIIWPDKVRINRRYVENYRFLDDLRILWRTVAGD